MLPQPAQTGTLLLHNVGALSLHDQRYLIEWLERAAGRTQVVSTTPVPLLPLVQAGTFLAQAVLPPEHGLRRSERDRLRPAGP